MRTKVHSREIDIALIDPTFVSEAHVFLCRLRALQKVVDIFQLYTAVARTLVCESNGNLTTKNLHTELIFNLSGTRNVRDSLRDFGIKTDSQSVLLCVFDTDENNLGAIEKMVDGECVSLSDIQPQDGADVNVVKNHYRVSENELCHCSLVDAIVSRIATKSWVK